MRITQADRMRLVPMFVVLSVVALAASQPEARAQALMEGKAKTDRTVSVEAVVAGSPDQVFRLWTTEDGVKQFFAPAARIEAREGGAYTMIFDPAHDPEGNSRGTRGARILHLAPGKGLDFEWIPFVVENSPGMGGPPGVPAAERNARPLPTWVEVSFDPVEGDARQTRVRLAHYGFRKGGKWDESFAYFQKAWAGVLSNLAKYCATQSVEKARITP